MEKCPKAAPILLAFILMSALIPVVFADTGETSGSGSATVGNATPSITSRSLAANAGGANITSGELTVNTHYWGNTTVADDNTLVDITNITICFNTTAGSRGSFDKEESYAFQYKNVSSVIDWGELTAGGWVWTGQTYLDEATCSYPTLTASSGEFKFNISFAKIASHNDGAAWEFYVYIKDTAAATDTMGEDDTWFDFAYYGEYTFASSITWTGLTAGDTNEEPGTPTNPINTNVVACNEPTDINFKGDGDLQKTGGGGTTWLLSSVTLGSTGVESGTTFGLSTSYQNLWDAVAAGTENTNKASYWAIDVPDPCIAGEYTFTYYINVVEDA